MRICKTIAACLSLWLAYPTCAQTLFSTTPEDVGLSSARLSYIDALLQRYVDEKKIAGGVTLVARRGKVAHFAAFGEMDEGKPMQRDAIFRIYSMTKPITSVAAMILYEEGHFQLYDPVAQYLPEFADLKVFAGETAQGIELSEPERPMTIHDLLTHTSGLSYGDSDTPVDLMYRKAGIPDFRSTPNSYFYTLPNHDRLADMVQKLSEAPLLFHPGERWHYSVSTDVLGHLVEVISGMPLDQFFAQRIFAPLNMVDTGFYVPEEKVARFTAGYGLDDSGALTNIDSPQTSPFTQPPTLVSGGGGLSNGDGLVSTASDYYNFAQMLLNGGHLNGTRLLSRKTVELMTENHLWGEYEEGYGFGLGFSVLVNLARSQELGSVGNFGWMGAANTWFLVDPREELVAIFMMQFVPYGHYPIINQFKTLAYQAIID